MDQILWAVTLKSFSDGKARLAPAVAAQRRSSLAEETARRVLEVCAAAPGHTAIVTPSADISSWAAEHSIEVIAEPAGGGLNGAAMAAAETAAERQMAYAIIHADLPMLQLSDLHTVAASPSAAVLSPSRNGGTSLVAASEPIRFSYGVDSFRLHLAAAAPLRPAIVVTAGLAVDLDTPHDLTRAAALQRGAWLRPFLS